MKHAKRGEWSTLLWQALPYQYSIAREPLSDGGYATNDRITGFQGVLDQSRERQVFHVRVALQERAGLCDQPNMIWGEFRTFLLAALPRQFASNLRAKIGKPCPRVVTGIESGIDGCNPVTV